MASKVSQYIMAYRKIPICLWHIDVGLHTFIFLFMTLYKGPLFQASNRLTYYAIINLQDSSAAMQFRSSKNDILSDKFWTNMINVWGIKTIFMAFWSAFSHKKMWGAFIRENTLYTSLLHYTGSIATST